MSTFDSSSLTKLKKALIIIIVSIEAGTLYRLPYLYETFYDQFQSLFAITNTQIGLLVTVFGSVGAIEVLFSGMLSDRFSPRKMIVISMVIMSVCGFVFATVPSYPIVALLYCFMAVASGIFFYCPSIRVLSSVDGEENQGNIFGLHEGIKGLSSTIASAIVLAIVTNLFIDANGLSYGYVFYAFLYLALAVASFFVLPDLPPQKSSEDTKGFDAKRFIEVAKLPGVWLVGLAMWGYYSVMCMMAYTTPYMTAVGVSAGALGVVAIIRSYTIGIFAAPIAGMTGNKIQSCSKVAMICCLLLVVISAGLLFLPATNSYAGIICVLAVGVGLFVYCLRGVSWATLPEAGIPMEFIGTASGMISLLAFTPDIYIYTLCGWLMDTYGEMGFKYIFALMLVMSIIALVSTYLIRRIQKKNLALAEN